MEQTKDKTCSICGREIDKQIHPESKEVIWDNGHNAMPVNEGRCCTRCNESIVIPRRIVDMRK